MKKKKTLNKIKYYSLYAGTNELSLSYNNYYLSVSFEWGHVKMYVYKYVMNKNAWYLLGKFCIVSKCEQTMCFVTSSNLLLLSRRCQAQIKWSSKFVLLVLSCVSHITDDPCQVCFIFFFKKKCFFVSLTYNLTSQFCRDYWTFHAIHPTLTHDYFSYLTWSLKIKTLLLNTKSSFDSVLYFVV